MDTYQPSDNSGFSEEIGPYRPEIIVAEVVPEHEEVLWIPQRRYRRRVWLPAALFVATCASTFWAGTYFSDSWDQNIRAAAFDGLKYAVAVMTILLCHEMGHFLQACRYRVHASLPLFIPWPLGPIGTFGAVIAMEPRKGDRKAIFDIGISGPLAGLVPTLIFCVLGLQWSTPSFKPPKPDELILGSSILFGTLSHYLVPHVQGAISTSLHPLAVAGWVGLLVTSLNLFPVGQLDGGHILYGMLRGTAHKVAAIVLAIAMFVVFFFGFWWWWPMLLLLVFMGIRHPPTANDHVSLGAGRYILGTLTLAFVVLGFTPMPIVTLEPVRLEKTIEVRTTDSFAPIDILTEQNFDQHPAIQPADVSRETQL